MVHFRQKSLVFLSLSALAARCMSVYQRNRISPSCGDLVNRSRAEIEWVEYMCDVLGLGTTTQTGKRSSASSMKGTKRNLFDAYVTHAGRQEAVRTLRLRLHPQQGAS